MKKGMDHSWNDPDRGTPKLTAPGKNPGLRGEIQPTNLLSNDTALY
jgi:hypothetical protein